MEVAHPADTILPVPLAVAIGAVMAPAMVMAVGAVAQLAVIAVWVTAVTAATATAAGEPLLPVVVDTTMALAAAAAAVTTMALAAAAAAVTGRRAALRAVGTRISG